MSLKLMSCLNIIITPTSKAGLVKIANEQLCSQPDHVYTRFKLSAHDFLNDWTASDLFDNYLWRSFHDLRAAVSYMVLCFMYTHESLSLSLLYLHIL